MSPIASGASQIKSIDFLRKTVTLWLQSLSVYFVILRDSLGLVTGHPNELQPKYVIRACGKVPATSEQVAAGRLWWRSGLRRELVHSNLPLGVGRLPWGAEKTPKTMMRPNDIFGFNLCARTFGGLAHIIGRFT